LNTHIAFTQGQARSNAVYIGTVYEYSYEPLIGRLIGCYYGHSNNNELRRNGASGGVVTSIVKANLNILPYSTALLLNKNVYNSYMANDVLPQGSEYHVKKFAIPTSEFIKIRHMDKVMVVCLPCQVKYFRNLCPEATIIGLFCSHRVEIGGVERISNSITAYRKKLGGQTGMAYAHRFIPTNIYWGRYLNYCYIPDDCLLCRDLTAEQADISIGDAHKHKEFYKGKNTIITRTKKGEIALNNAIEAGILNVTKTNPASIINTQPYIKIKKGKYNLKTKCYVIARGLGCMLSRNDKLFNPIFRLWVKAIKMKETNAKLYSPTKNNTN